MLDCNTYLIRDETTVIIDPGNKAIVDQLVNDLKSDGIDIKDIDIIANTHLHLDHCLADESIKSISEAKIALFRTQKLHQDVALKKVSQFFGVSSPNLSEDMELKSRIDTGKLEISILSTPGHSPDHICFYCDQQGFLICGDLIFNKSTGRVDLPGGDGAKIKESIEAVANLSCDLLLPGHMEIIQRKDQVKENYQYIRKFVLSMF